MKILTDVMKQEKESACGLYYYSCKFSFKDSFSALYFYLNVCKFCVCVCPCICVCVIVWTAH